VAEGVLAGCRVVCSDIPAHREIGEGICHFVPIREDAEIALAYAISAALREAKPKPVLLPHLSPPVLAKQYIALYRRLVASVSPVRSKREKNAFGAANSSSSLLEDHDLALQGRGE